MFSVEERDVEDRSGGFDKAQTGQAHERQGGDGTDPLSNFSPRVLAHNWA